ncbi:MAG: hypothetical protein GX417_04795 [Clostridiales bacterium]|nr:hypothetical protein [Clostridiales bacterium]
MGSKRPVGVRYCGGCNPRFDRVGFVRRLQEEFPEISIEYAEEGRQYAAVLVVCGCHAACASQNGLSNAPEILVVRSEADVPAAKALLKRAMLQ